MGFLDKFMRRDAPALTEEQRKQWEEDGFLILRSYVSKQEVAKVLDIVDQQWGARDGNDHLVDVLSGPKAGEIFRLYEIDPNDRREVYKLNNLFARIEDIRDVALSPRLKSTIEELLGGEPLICNSLNFERGSQQPYHLDTWYMPPPVDDMMVAASIALEDVDSHNGPMIFYPGSHRIPTYLFSSGMQNMISEEAGACGAHLSRHIEEMGLKPVEFSGGAGDVFLWHARLFHGGTAIRDMARTRNSLVVHYWRECDLAAEHVRHGKSGKYLGVTLRGEIQF